MKVKIVVKFRSREMAPTVFGFQLIEKFLKEIAPYGNPDSNPKLLGKAINVMISPFPRNKRAKNPNEANSTARHETNNSHHTENGAPRPQHSHPTLSDFPPPD